MTGVPDVGAAATDAARTASGIRDSSAHWFSGRLADTDKARQS